VTKILHCLVIIQRDHRKICHTIYSHFHDSPVPSPDSRNFQAWKMRLLNSRTFQDLYEPCPMMLRCTTLQLLRSSSWSAVHLSIPDDCKLLWCCIVIIPCTQLKHRLPLQNQPFSTDNHLVHSPCNASLCHTGQRWRRVHIHELSFTHDYQSQGAQHIIHIYCILKLRLYGNRCC